MFLLNVLRQKLPTPVKRVKIHKSWKVKQNGSPSLYSAIDQLAYLISNQ